MLVAGASARGGICVTPHTDGRSKPAPLRAEILVQKVGGVLTHRTQASLLPGLFQRCFMLLAK